MLGKILSILNLLAVVYLVARSLFLKDKCERLEANLQAAQQDLYTYENRNGILVSCIDEQVYKSKELKQHNAALAEEVRLLGIKLRKVQSATTVAQQHTVEVKLDTVKIENRDTIYGAPYAISFSDAWFSATLKGDSLYVSMRDSLTIVRHTKRRRFLWWTWNKYSNKVSVTNNNPYVTVDGITSVEIQ